VLYANSRGLITWPRRKKQAGAVRRVPRISDLATSLCLSEGIFLRALSAKAESAGRKV